MRAPDGFTAYQRVRSKLFRTRLLRFGEMCSYKVGAHEPLPSSGDGRRWHVGAFIGIDRRTGQYMTHDGGEVKYARTILRMPEANKFDRTELAKIAVTPWDLHVPREDAVVLKDKKEVVDDNLQDKAAMSRQVYIKPSDIQEFGLTRLLSIFVRLIGRVTLFPSTHD